MNEIIRRVILALGLFSGLWLICSVPPELYSIKVEDWKDERMAVSREHKDPSSKERALEELIEKETMGRVFVTEEKDWIGLWAGVSQTLADVPPSPAWTKRLGRSFYDDHLFFSPDESPLIDLNQSLTQASPFTYVELRSRGSKQHLAVTRRIGGDISRYAPTSLAYPGRFLGFLILLLTVCLYALIPWQKHGVEALRYSRARSSVLPDIMGAVLAGLFFALPILITNDNGMGDGIFSEGWIILTAVMWFMALFGVSLWAVSAWYASLLLELTPEGLRLKTLTREALIPFSHIDKIELGRIDKANLNRALIILSFLISWKALGPALLASGPEHGLIFTLRSGKKLTFPLRAAIGFPQMIGRLMDLGIPICESVFEGFGAKRAAPELRLPFPPLPKGIGSHVALACFALPLVLLSLLHLPASTLTLPLDGDLAKPPALAADDWAPSSELLAEESRIQAEMTKLQKRMRELEALVKNAPPEQQRAAALESEECLKKFMDLSEEFDKKRRAAGAPY